MKTKIFFMILLLHAACGWCSDSPLIVTVSNNFPPFSFLNVESRPAGMFVDIWRLWAEKTGRNIQFRPEPWVDTLKSIKTGDADIHGGLFQTEERKKWMAFSRPFYEIDIHLIFPANQKITGIEELTGCRVGVHRGTFQQDWLHRHYPGIRVVPLNTTRELIFAVRKGRIKAFLADIQTIWSHLNQLGLTAEFKTAPGYLYSKAFHAGVQKADTKLLELVNEGFNAISDDELTEIERRWLSNFQFPSRTKYRQRLRLSDSEKRFIAAHPVVSVGLIPGFEPYMFIGNVRGIYIENRLKSDYPEIDLLPADDHLKALENVSFGAADAYIGPLSVAGYLIRHHRLTHLKIASPAGYPPAQVKFGIRKDWPELAAILNRAISTVSRQELDAVYQKWVPVVYERSIDWAYVWRWIAGIVAGFGILLAVSLWWNRKLTLEIRERKTVQRALKRIEWLLTKSVTPRDSKESLYQPPYGDVTALNTRRIILDAVGKETLRRIAEDAIDLLNTSTAIYEENGDYAFGMFSSGWCRLFDQASRNLCKTDDNRTALSCGRWLCHENCWNDSAKTAIQTGKPTDIQCVGGIHLYAVPIFAPKQVVGAINIGYGDPPANEDDFLELSRRFDIDVEEIRKARAAYKSRPGYIIELARKRLHTSAELIGEIVERRRAEENLRENRSCRYCFRIA